MRATGQYGELRVGYQRAAALAAWEVRPSEPPAPGALRAFTVSARVTHEHQYWSTQPPFGLVLRVGPCDWFWPKIESVQRDGDALAAVVRGAPQVIRRR